MARKNGTGNGSHKSVQDARTDLLARAERNAEGAASCKTDPLGDDLFRVPEGYTIVK